jgi:rhodanese-related sulfurtransferase
MKKIILATLLLSMSLFADFKSIGVAEFKKLQKEGVLVIDIRTAWEWKETGIIEGSKKMTFLSEQGQPLWADWFFELGKTLKDKSEPFIIYCAHASRTYQLGKYLEKAGFENVSELKGGIENGWIKAGEKVVKE